MRLPILLFVIAVSPFPAMAQSSDMLPDVSPRLHGTFGGGPTALDQPDDPDPSLQPDSKFDEGEPSGMVGVGNDPIGSGAIVPDYAEGDEGESGEGDQTDDVHSPSME